MHSSANPCTAGILPLRELSAYSGMHKPETVLVIRVSRRRSSCFEKSLLGIQETSQVFGVASESERYFKDTVAVFGWAQGVSEEKDFQLRDFSKVSGGN